MKTFLAQNQFISNSAAHVPVASGSAAITLSPPSTAAAVTISESTLDPATDVDAAAGPDLTDPPVPAAVTIPSSDGEDHANLQNMHSASSTRGFSCGAESERRPDGNMQVLPEAKTSRQTHSRQEMSEESFEGKSTRSCPGCSSTREDVEAAALPELQHADADTPVGCSPPGLLKTTRSYLALPSMSWDRASFLEAGCLEADGLQADGGVEGHPPQATGEAESADVRQTAGIEPGPSEAIPASRGGRQETPASAHTKNPDVGVLADRIDWHEFFNAVMDERVVLFELYDEVPLFIRDGDHLRRWA